MTIRLNADSTHDIYSFIVTYCLIAHCMLSRLKGLFHPACVANVVSLFASVAAIFMVHENGDEQRQAKR